MDAPSLARPTAAPTPWRRFVGACGAALVLVAAVALPVLSVVAHAQVLLTDEERFITAFAPLAKDPGMQEHLVDAVVEQIDIPDLAARMEADLSGLTGVDVPTLEVPRWLSDSARTLSGWGAPSWLTDPLIPSDAGTPVTVEQLTAHLVGTVEDGVRAALAFLVDTDTFSIGWQEGLRSSHAQVLEQFQSGGSGPAHAPLTVDIHPIVAAVKESLVSSGAPYAQYIPTDWQYTAVLLPGEEMARTAPAVALVLKHGPHGRSIAIAGVLVGITLTVRRILWATIAAAVVALASGGLLAVASGWRVEADSIEQVVLSAFTDALAPPAASSLVMHVPVAAVLAVGGGLVLLLRSRRVREDRPGR